MLWSSRDLTYNLRQLHWLPVRHRVEFNLAVLVFKAAARSSSAVSGWWLSTRHCRWPSSTTIVRRTHPHSSWRSVIRSRWTTFCGTVYLWTSWSDNIFLGHFRRALKTHLFWTESGACSYLFIYLLTYLLTTVWRCQKWHCLNVFNAVLRLEASNATKCILDIPPHLFLCSYCTSQAWCWCWWSEAPTDCSVVWV